jgi:integrase
LESFTWAVSRFECFCALKRGKGEEIILGESLICEFVDTFLCCLTRTDGSLVVDVGSYFPTVSMIKKYLYLRYSMKLPSCIELNAMLKVKTKSYQPQKKKVFTFEQLTKWGERPNQHAGEIQQQTLIAFCSFFALSRADEIIRITKEQVVLKEDKFYFRLSRYSKNPGETLVCIKNTSSLNFVQMMKEHLQRIPSENSRIWWRFNSKTLRFCGQNIGKSVVTKISRLIASFHNLKPEEYGSHSFRRSGATALANAGANCQELMSAGHWKNLQIARSYVEASEPSALKRSEMIANVNIETTVPTSTSATTAASIQNFENCTVVFCNSFSKDAI